MTRHTDPRDEGSALITAMLLMMVALIIGSSLMQLSQTETYASMNYTSMTQARFAAESGVHKAVNYLLNSYTNPGDPADPLAAYNTTVSPVTAGGAPVVLSARADVPANYPVAATQAAFFTAAHGTLAAGTGTVQYEVSAQLLVMGTVVDFGADTAQTVQTWRITGVGSTGGARPALVEVSVVLERQARAVNAFGLFATGAACGAIDLNGGSFTGSYDSSAITWAATVPPVPVVSSTGGDAGSNGNLKMSGGSTHINGSYSSPKTGSGSCSSGSPNAVSASGGSSVTGTVVTMPQPVVFPTPAAPVPSPPTTAQTVNGTATCASALFAVANCTGSPGALVLDPAGTNLAIGNLNVSSTSLHLKAGTYNINSLNMSGGSQLILDTVPVIFRFAGVGAATPINMSGGSVANSTYVSQNFQILYGGAGTVNLSGGSGMALIVLAPNADIAFSGGSRIYGSIVGKTIAGSGGTQIVYDTSLGSNLNVVWNSMMSAFTWKRY